MLTRQRHPSKALNHGGDIRRDRGREDAARAPLPGDIDHRSKKPRPNAGFAPMLWVDPQTLDMDETQ